MSQSYCVLWWPMLCRNLIDCCRSLCRNLTEYCGSLCRNLTECCGGLCCNLTECCATWLFTFHTLSFVSNNYYPFFPRALLETYNLYLVLVFLMLCFCNVMKETKFTQISSPINIFSYLFSMEGFWCNKLHHNSHIVNIIVINQLHFNLASWS